MNHGKNWQLKKNLRKNTNFLPVDLLWVASMTLKMAALKFYLFIFISQNVFETLSDMGHKCKISEKMADCLQLIFSLMSDSSHIGSVLIGVQYPNCPETLDVYLLFAILHCVMAGKLRQEKDCKTA